MNLECADTSALWNDATCRVEESGVKPPQSKVGRVLKANQYHAFGDNRPSGMPLLDFSISLPSLHNIVTRFQYVGCLSEPEEVKAGIKQRMKN